MRTAAIPSFNVILSIWLALTLAEWVRRVFWMRSFRSSHPPLAPHEAKPGAPKVSVIVPARNEEKNIARCLDTLFKQAYPDFEIIVIDDRSTDRTPEILEDYRLRSPVPFRVVRIEKLPEGWTGKNHGMFAGSKAARGEWFFFTDADTTHEASCLSTAVETALERKIDFLTLAPETACVTFWEKTVQPLAVSSIALWFNPIKVNDPESGVVLANGQLILIKKSVYEKIGGNEAVKNQVVEDVELAKLARGAGFHVQFLDGTRLYATRMYSSLAEIHRGWTRIFTHLFEKNVLRLFHKIALFLFFSILPFAALAAELALKAAGSARFDAGVLAWSAAASGWIVLVRSVGNKMLKTDPRYSLLHPLGSLVMVWILGTCVGRVWFNRPSPWRGDALR